MLTAIVGSRQGFLEYCREHDINPRSKEFIHVASPEGARGYHFDELVEVYNNWSPTYWNEVMLNVRLSIRPEVKNG